MKQYFPKRGKDKTAGQVYGLKWWKRSLPRPLRGVSLDFTQFLLLFFIGLRGLTARAVRHWLLFHQGNREAA
jgi:hypothetical protein